jgi:hypothetical protein
MSTDQRAMALVTAAFYVDGKSAIAILDECSREELEDLAMALAAMVKGHLHGMRGEDGALLEPESALQCIAASWASEEDPPRP